MSNKYSFITYIFLWLKAVPHLRFKAYLSAFYNCLKSITAKTINDIAKEGSMLIERLLYIVYPSTKEETTSKNEVL